MKKITPFLTLSIAFLMACQPSENRKEENLGANQLKIDTTDATNYFYDNAETYILPTGSLQIEGEVTNAGPVDFSELTLHTVIVKEAVLAGDGNAFTGAYRYDGYSLIDILNYYGIEKANREEFEPLIDLFVEIENDASEKVVLSWGEIFYPNHLHEIIIAHRVMRIVPSKTNELWPLPGHSKLVVGTDLISERNIPSPSKITVRSYPKSIEVIKGKKPLYSPEVDFFKNGELLLTLDQEPENHSKISFESIFYGRGRGIHSTTPFQGTLLKDILKSFTVITPANIKEGLILVVADDGYRVVFSLSEVMNRNDQSEVLLIHQGNQEDGGMFRLFPACDFFSDRAIKAVSQISLDIPE